MVGSSDWIEPITLIRRVQVNGEAGVLTAECLVIMLNIAVCSADEAESSQSKAFWVILAKCSNPVFGESCSGVAVGPSGPKLKALWGLAVV